MAKAFGIEIEDGSMRSIASKLIGAHICVTILALIYGVVQIVQNLELQKALDKLAEADPNAETRDQPGGPLNLVLNSVVPLVTPSICLLLVCMGIKGNNKCMLQTVCIFDGIGTCLECIGTIAGVMGFLLFGFLTNAAKDAVCENDESYATCEETRKSAEDLFGLLAIFSLVGTVLALISMCTCGFATAQANNGTNAIAQNKKFTQV